MQEKPLCQTRPLILTVFRGYRQLSAYHRAFFPNTNVADPCEDAFFQLALPMHLLGLKQETFTTLEKQTVVSAAMLTLFTKTVAHLLINKLLLLLFIRVINKRYEMNVYLLSYRTTQ